MEEKLKSLLEYNPKTGIFLWAKDNGKKIWLGYFNTKEEAAKAYNKAAIKYFGEFSRLNEI